MLAPLGTWMGRGGRRPAGRSRQIRIAGIAVIRQKRRYYAQGFDLCFHFRQLDFFLPENFVRIFHKVNTSKKLKSYRFLAAFKKDCGKNSNPKELTLPARNSLKAVRDTKCELMTCLQIHAGQDIARGLSQTKIESELGFFHSPTVNRQSS